jgi:hypothetical protein
MFPLLVTDTLQGGEIVNKAHALLVLFFILLITVDPAFADTGYGISTLVPYLLIVPLTYLFLRLGGVYFITDRRKRYRRIIILFVLGYLGIAVLALVIAVSFGINWLRDFGEFSMIAAIPFFGILIGGFMIYLGIRCSLPDRPAYLTPVRPLQMLVSGVTLVAFIFVGLFFIWHQATEFRREMMSRDRAYLFEKVYEAQMEYFAENNAFFKDNAAIGLDEDRVRYLRMTYQYEFISADEKGFLFRIWGNIDRDPNLDIWEHTEQSPVPYRVFDDEIDEGVQIDPRDPKPYTPADWGTRDDGPT